MPTFSRRAFGATIAAGAAALISPTSPPQPTPPIMTLVSGGKLSSENQRRLREYMDQGWKGAGFHRVLVLEPQPNNPTIEIRDGAGEKLYFARFG